MIAFYHSLQGRSSSKGVAMDRHLLRIFNGTWLLWLFVVYAPWLFGSPLVLFSSFLALWPVSFRRSFRIFFFILASSLNFFCLFPSSYPLRSRPLEKKEGKEKHAYNSCSNLQHPLPIFNVHSEETAGLEIDQNEIEVIIHRLSGYSSARIRRPLPDRSPSL